MTETEMGTADAALCINGSDVGTNRAIADAAGMCLVLVQRHLEGEVGEFTSAWRRALVRRRHPRNASCGTILQRNPLP